METAQKFESWGVLEIMGHRQYAGYITEQTIAGAGVVRVDVPATEGPNGAQPTKAYTKYIGSQSIYCFTPTDEATARIAARSIEKYRGDPLPVSIVPERALPAGETTDAEIDDEPDPSFDDDDDDDRPF